MTGSTPPSADPNPGQQPEPVIERRGRPWLGVTVACAVAAVVLLLLLIPGVLRFPDARGTVPDDHLLELQRETNRALEDRLRELQQLSETAVCRAGDSYFGAMPGLDGEDLLAPLTPGPAATPMPRPEDLAVSPSATPPDAPPAGSLLETLDAASAFILTADGDSVGTGSGFFVAPEMLMTNLHVVGNPPSTNIMVFNPRLGGGTRAEVVAHSGTHEFGEPDFALLRVPGATDVGRLALTPAVDRMDQVISAGFPWLVVETDEQFQRITDGDLTAIPTMVPSDGIVSALQSPSGNPLILHTATVSPGNSGGPLVDLCGRVVGINTFVRSEETFRRMNYALAGPSIADFLRANGVTPSFVDSACDPAAIAAAQPPAESDTTPPDTLPPDALPPDEGDGGAAAPADSAPEAAGPDL